MDTSKFIHKKDSRILNSIREVIFGLEDGMVSTLGAITGIAIGTQSRFTVILSGLIIIAVESISMAVGSFLSSSSEEEIDQRKIKEESFEIKNFPEEEKQELLKFYKHEGWPDDLAKEMSEHASKNHNLILKEMMARELKVFPKKSDPFRNGIAMFFAYIIGGLIPLFMYFLIGLPQATYYSILFTLVGLFSLGIFVSKLSFNSWLKTGAKMLILGGLALAAGIIMSLIAEHIKI